MARPKTSKTLEQRLMEARAESTFHDPKLKYFPIESTRRLVTSKAIEKEFKKFEIELSRLKEAEEEEDNDESDTVTEDDEDDDDFRATTIMMTKKMRKKDRLTKPTTIRKVARLSTSSLPATIRKNSKNSRNGLTRMPTRRSRSPSLVDSVR